MVEIEPKKTEEKKSTTPLAVAKTIEQRRKEVWAQNKMLPAVEAWNKKHPNTLFSPEYTDAAYKEFYKKDIMDETPSPVVCRVCKKIKGETEDSCSCGRPLKYSEEMIIKAKEYIDSCEDKEEERVKQSNDKKGYEMVEYKLRVKLPTIEGLAYFLKISRDTLYQWEKDHPQFSDILEVLRLKQSETLINKGLSGDYNSTMAKMMMTKHGYRDESKSELTGPNGGPVKIEGVEIMVRPKIPSPTP